MKKRCLNGHTHTGATMDDVMYCSMCGAALVVDTSPLTVDVYVHESAENLVEQGEELGLTGDALEEFTRSLYEVKLTLRVDPFSGLGVIVGVDNIPLKGIV